MAGLFDIGPYFNIYSENIIKGVIPSAQFKRQEQTYKDVCLLVVFVNGFEGIFDSTDAVLEHNQLEGEDPCDLRNTLQYKLLTICGTFVKVNKKTQTQVVWVEETRSVELSAE